MLAKNLYALELQDACKALRSKAKVRYLVVERESKLPLNMQCQKKPQTVVEEPQLEMLREDQVEASTHAETSSRGEFQAKWAEGSHASIPLGVRWGDVK